MMQLEKGLDFRKPQYRREVFLRFYEFHLKYRSHPGAVYFMFPYLKKRFNLTQEQMYWMTFINGMSQHIVTTWVLFNKFPTFKDTKPDDIQKYILDNWSKLDWDMDRRYWKTKFGKALESYKALVKNKTQQQYWEELGDFKTCWNTVLNNFYAFGRLSTFSFLEYQRIIGLDIDCDDLFLEDKGGSKSHRNGLCIVLGRDDLDWRDDNLDFKGYTKEDIEWLKLEGELLLNEAKARFAGREFFRDVSYFTLESTLCCYKSWHRKNRRYPNVYMDMFHDRIKKMEVNWNGEYDFNMFWEARKENLPKHLRLEDNPTDPGLKPLKQNHYRETGQVIMMDEEWDCFENDFNNKVKNDMQIERFLQ